MVRARESERLADLEDVAGLYAEQAARVRRLVGAAVRAPEAVIEDACQIAWSRLICHRERVHRQTAPAWVLRTAIREAIKLQRPSERELPLESLEVPAGALGDPAPDLLDRLMEHRERLDAIRMLPERQRRLVWMQGLGLTYAEIASRTGDSRRTVERQLLRAKHTLERRAA